MNKLLVEGRLGFLVPEGVLMDQIAAAAAENLASGAWCKVSQVGFKLVLLEEVQNIVDRPEAAVFVSVDEKWLVLAEGSYHETSWQCDGFQVEIAALCHQQVEYGEAYGDAFAGFEQVVQEAVGWVVKVVTVARKGIFVE